MIQVFTLGSENPADLLGGSLGFSLHPSAGQAVRDSLLPAAPCSEKPPSSDIAKPKPKQQRPGRPKKRRQGGQPGHQKHLRQPLPPERVHEIIAAKK